MKSNKVMEMLGKAEVFTRRNSPAILTGLAIVGVISTAYTAYKAGSRAEEILETYHRDMKDCHPEDKEAKRTVTKEMVKKMAPVVTPVVIAGGMTVGCVLGSHSASNRRIAALSAAYTVSETAVKNLNVKMEEILGEKKAKTIKDAIAKDKLKADAEKDKKTIAEPQFIMPGDGTVLCKDLYTGKLFYSNAEKIKQAIVKCSYDIIYDMYISLNDFYEAIDSPQLNRDPMGEDIGWNVDDTIGGKLPITLSALLTDEGKPILCVDYTIGVRDDFRNLH